MDTEPELAQRVTAALEVERRVNLHRYPVRVSTDRNTLRLEGRVESVAAKRIAMRIAGELAAPEGVVLVDALEVAPAAERADGDLLDAYTGVLLASPEFRPVALRRKHRDAVETLRATANGEPAGEVAFAVREGVVELEGSVPSLSHRRVAEALAWWVGGCRNVVNRLVVEPAERDGDGELADAVGLVLEIDPTLRESQPIGVDATGGVVTLTGALIDDGQRQRAEHDAWCVDGVREVRNAIRVAS